MIFFRYELCCRAWLRRDIKWTEPLRAIWVVWHRTQSSYYPCALLSAFVIKTLWEIIVSWLQTRVTRMAAAPSASAIRALALEYKSLAEDPVEGFRVKLLNDEDMFLWEVALFGPPDTLYQGGYFKVRRAQRDVTWDMVWRWCGDVVMCSGCVLTVFSVELWPYSQHHRHTQISSGLAWPHCAPRPVLLLLWFQLFVTLNCPVYIDQIVTLNLLRKYTSQWVSCLKINLCKQSFVFRSSRSTITFLAGTSQSIFPSQQTAL